MTSFDDIHAFFSELDYKLIIAADGETRTHQRRDGRIVEHTAAGGVGVAFDVVCQAADALYITRGRTPEDREVLDADGKVRVSGRHGSYTIKRLFFSPEEEAAYYAGFANQTLWPLCHVAFERPIFRQDWWEGYVDVNQRFAAAIQEEITERTIVWVNDYQLALVPHFLRQRNDTVVALFWHIPWPTYEIFRILPYKQELLEGLLACDFVAFHRRYQARNFLSAVENELPARIDSETDTVFIGPSRTRVADEPMGIDVDVIRTFLHGEHERPTFLDAIRNALGIQDESRNDQDEDDTLSRLARQYRIMVGVDRLDYTKGIPERLLALDQFFEENPDYRGKVVYVGVMSPTRASIPAYQALREDVEHLAEEINSKYAAGGWQPLHMLWEGLSRDEAVDLYRKAAVCLVTPVDDGMNLVSKEFVVAASCSDDPGMLVLSQFAGSASDLGAAILVNPYDRRDVSEGIKRALEMPLAERRERIAHMRELLEDRDVYQWAISFVRNAVVAAREQWHESAPVH